MNVEATHHSIVQDAPMKPFHPGHLLKPFGWAAQPLAPMIQSSPQLVRRALELDRARMHLIALALAHLDNAGPDITRVLILCATQEGPASRPRSMSSRHEADIGSTSTDSIEPTGIPVSNYAARRPQVSQAVAPLRPHRNHPFHSARAERGTDCAQANINAPRSVR